jgi:predicted RNase H-like HicB family nuclease
LPAKRRRGRRLLPELITEGDTVHDVLDHVGDVLAAIIEAYEDLGRPIPWERLTPSRKSL